MKKPARMLKNSLLIIISIAGIFSLSYAQQQKPQSPAGDAATTSDNPIIREFISTPAIIIEGGPVNLKWTVESAPGGSAIKKIWIGFVAGKFDVPEIHSSSQKKGEYVFNIPPTTEGITRQFILTAITQAGGSAIKTIDVQTISTEEALRKIKSSLNVNIRVTPDQVIRDTVMRFSLIVSANNRSGIRLPKDVSVAVFIKGKYDTEKQISNLSNTSLNLGNNEYNTQMEIHHQDIENAIYSETGRRLWEFYVRFKYKNSVIAGYKVKMNENVFYKKEPIVRIED